MIGNRLKRAREALGFSLRELEAAIQGQVSAQAIGKYERDEMMPSSTILLALASPELDLLGLSVVAGNVPLHHTERNARAQLRRADRQAAQGVAASQENGRG